MSPAAIEVHGLEKSYGRRAVLRGVDLNVRKGEVFCLLGPNGAGKTTTIEILEGYRDATAGTVRVLGTDPAGQPGELRDRIGVVLQECAFPLYLRVGELIDAYRRYFTNPRRREELLEVVELGDEADTHIRHLSGGQRRRLDLALALVGNPELIFLDEPTTGFDPEARRRCWEAIENLRTLGATVLLTTHYLDEAERLADRVAVLLDGRISACGTPAELAQRSGAPAKITFTVPTGVEDSVGRLARRLQITVDGDRCVITTDHPTETLRTLLAWTKRHRLDRLDGLSVVPPSLEDVYLRLVSNAEAR